MGVDVILLLSGYIFLMICKVDLHVTASGSGWGGGGDYWLFGGVAEDRRRQKMLAKVRRSSLDSQTDEAQNIQNICFFLRLPRLKICFTSAVRKRGALCNIQTSHPHPDRYSDWDFLFWPAFSLAFVLKNNILLCTVHLRHHKLNICSFVF